MDSLMDKNISFDSLISIWLFWDILWHALVSIYFLLSEQWYADILSGMLSRIYSDWLFLASILAFFLKFFLTFFLACYPASILSFFLASICHLFNSDILSDMYASYRTYTWIEMGSKECRPSWSILTSTLTMLFWHSLSVIPSDILSGMCLGPDPDRVRKCRSGPGRYHNTLAIWGSGAGVAHRIRSWQTGRRRQKE